MNKLLFLLTFIFSLLSFSAFGQKACPTITNMHIQEVSRTQEHICYQLTLEYDCGILEESEIICIHRKCEDFEINEIFQEIGTTAPTSSPEPTRWSYTCTVVVEGIHDCSDVDE